MAALGFRASADYTQLSDVIETIRFLTLMLMLIFDLLALVVKC